MTNPTRSSVYAVTCLLSLITGLAGCAFAPAQDEKESPVVTASGEALTAANGYRAVPGGWLVHRSCVHEVPSGSEVKKGPDNTAIAISPDGTQTTFAPCDRPVRRAEDVMREQASPPTVGGWVENSCTAAPTNGGRPWFNRISGQWTVPAAPTQNGGLIYLFQDLVDVGASCTQGVATSEILQPVLQYGVGPDFGDNSWQLASWWVAPEAPAQPHSMHFIHSAPIRLNVGDQVVGDISATTCTTAGVCRWLVSANNKSVLIVTTTTSAFRRADQGVLEVQNVANCNQLPGGSSGGIFFTNTFLYQPPPTGDQNSKVEMYFSASWSAHVTPNLSPACNYGAFNSNRGMTLDF